MNILKNSITVIILLIFILLSCQEQSLLETEIDAIKQARFWFEKNETNLNTRNGNSSRLNLRFEKSPDWRASRVFKTKDGFRGVEVSLKYERHLILTDPSRNSDNLNPFGVLYSLLLIEIAPGNYVTYLLKFFPDNQTANEYDFHSLNYSQIPKSFTGNIMVFDWNENFLGGIRVENGKKEFFYNADNERSHDDGKIEKSNGWTCSFVTIRWYSVACYDGNCAEPVLIDETTSYMCEYSSLAPGDDFGGGGPGDPSVSTCFVEHPFIQGLMVPCYQGELSFGVDCASFNFVTTNSSENYQEAAVSNIRFTVKFIDPNTLIQTNTEFRIARPIWFGLPAITYNQSLITPGEAAEIAASAVQYASDLTHILYIENPNTPISTAETVFMSFLKSKMLYHGGRADFYGSGSQNVVPTTAQYATFGNGNCN